MVCSKNQGVKSFHPTVIGLQKKSMLCTLQREVDRNDSEYKLRKMMEYNREYVLEPGLGQVYVHKQSSQLLTLVLSL